MTDKLIVLVTCGKAPEAHKIAQELVRARLAACVNVLSSPVRSVYRWKRKVKAAAEVLLVIKTSEKRFPALRSTIERLHSYDVPEILALPIAAGSAAYLRWLGESLRAP